MRGVRRLAAATAVLALLVGSCSPGEDGEPPDEPEPGVAEAPETVGEPAGGGTLRIGLDVDPVSLDPRFVVDDEGVMIVDALFDPLLRYDADGELVGAAAERWEVSEDGRRFTFHLRPATFHDGEPVRAQDFARTLHRIADGTGEPRSFLAYLLADVRGAAEAEATGAPLDGVRVLDDHTLEIELDEPQPGFLGTLTDPSLVPTPEHADYAPGRYAHRPIGNGPFSMAGPREEGAFIRLARFEDHHAPPLLEEVLFVIYPEGSDPDAAFDDLVAGQLHIGPVTAERRLEALDRFGRSPDGASGPGLLDGIGSTVYLYGFDTTGPPFDDVRVRRAVSLAIDRDALAGDVLQGTRVPASAIVPPSIPGSQAGACTYCRHDPEEAARLLADVLAGEDGAPGEGDSGPDGAADATADGPDDPAPEPADDPPTDGTESDGGEDTGGEDTEDTEETPPRLTGFTLSHNRGGVHTAIAERMARDIQSALDLDVDFQARDLQSFVQAARAGELAAFRIGWNVSDADPGAYLYPLFHSSQRGVDNQMGFASEQVDELLDQGRAAATPRERRAAYAAAERLILEAMPVMPLLWYRHELLVLPEARDVRVSPVGRIDLTKVWLDRS